MTEAQTIYKLRVDRSDMRGFPFDLVYLVPPDQQSVCARLFPWSLCFMAKADMTKRLGQLKISEHETIPFDAFRVRRNGTADDRFAFEKGKPDWFVVVPILPLATRKDFPTKRYPAYLTAPQHAKEDSMAFEGILDDDTVLFTPEGPVQPVCLKCPRHMVHVQGKCSLGSRFCYEELVLKGQVEDDVELQEDNSVDDHSS
jgi:hypothetical protein